MASSLAEADWSGIAAELLQALAERRTVSPLTLRYRDITIDDAYRIQQLLQARQEDAGARVVGRKIGVTSKAVQDMLGVDQPDFGFLTEKMRYSNQAVISLAAANLIQPRAEGEIAFRLKHGIEGPGITREDVLAATDKVAPCFEIVDSRIADWKIRIEDTIADNASCGLFVLGDTWTDPSGVALDEVSMDMFHNGSLACSGKGSAVQGHPAEAVAWLANRLGALGVGLRPGDIILSGALSRMVDVKAGDRFDLSMSALGGASVSFVE